MLSNNITVEYLKSFEPNIENLLWTGETDFSKQITAAEDIVFNDLSQKGVDSRKAMPELDLRAAGTSLSATTSSTGVNDTMGRRRVIIDTITNTLSGKVLTLQGSHDNSSWVTIDTVTIATSDTWSTIAFKRTYEYYRITATIVTGAIDFRAYLVETKYDLLFAFKILVLIYRNAKLNGGSQYQIKEDDFEKEYVNLLNSGKYEIDTDNDGIADDYVGAGSITMLK